MKRLFVLLFLVGCVPVQASACLDNNPKKLDYDIMLRKQQITVDEYFSLIEDLKTLEKMKNVLY